MSKQTYKFKTNASQNQDRIMIQCRTEINRDAVKRTAIDGVEHVIVTSATLPDDIVMNGGLYPADEIAKSFQTLDLTLAPIEHPHINGEFISANDPRAIHDFHAGAYNMNVRRENGRVWVDKYINVAEAKKSDRGKRLLDRIEELENSDSPRPIHTSVGVYVMPEELTEPKVNKAGQEYTWIARDMLFDHDAILLDSVGAAQPHQGVGVAVNRKGQKCKVQRFEVDAVKAAKRLPLAPTGTEWDSGAADKRVREAIGAEDAPNSRYAQYHLWYDSTEADSFGAYKLPFVDIIDGEAHAVPNALRNAAARLSQTDGPTDAEKTRIKAVIDSYLSELRDNAIGDISYQNLIDQLTTEVKGKISVEWCYVVDVVDDQVIFDSSAGYFQVPFRVDDGTARIVGIPVSVDRVTTYIPKTNQSKGDAMKDLILNALKEAGIETDGKSDQELFEAYNQLQAKEQTPSGGPAGDDNGIAEAVANALKPLAEKLDGVEKKLNSNDEAETNRLAEIVANSGKYPGMDVDSAKLLPVEKLKELAGNCQSSYGISPIVNGQPAKESLAPADMPE